jgi:hypothetical protein
LKEVGRRAVPRCIRKKKNIKLMMLLLHIENAIITMTFKDLKKRVISSNQQQQQTQSFDKLQNKPFWIWNIEEHKQEETVEVAVVAQAVHHQVMNVLIDT